MHSEDILNRWGFENITDKNIFSTDYVIFNVFKVFFRHRDRFKIKRSTALVNVLFLCDIMNGVGLKRFNFVLQ